MRGVNGGDEAGPQRSRYIDTLTNNTTLGIPQMKKLSALIAMLFASASLTAFARL